MSVLPPSTGPTTERTCLFRFFDEPGVKDFVGDNAAFGRGGGPCFTAGAAAVGPISSPGSCPWTGRSRRRPISPTTRTCCRPLRRGRGPAGACRRRGFATLFARVSYGVGDSGDARVRGNAETHWTLNPKVPACWESMDTLGWSWTCPAPSLARRLSAPEPFVSGDPGSSWAPSRGTTRTTCGQSLRGELLVLHGTSSSPRHHRGSPGRSRSSTQAIKP